MSFIDLFAWIAVRMPAARAVVVARGMMNPFCASFETSEGGVQ